MNVQIITYPFSLVHRIFNLSTNTGAASDLGNIKNILIPWPDRTFWEAEPLSPCCLRGCCCLQGIQVWVDSIYREDYKRRMPLKEGKPSLAVVFAKLSQGVAIKTLLALLANRYKWLSGVCYFSQLRQCPYLCVHLVHVACDSWDTSRRGLPRDVRFGALHFGGRSWKWWWGM